MAGNHRERRDTENFWEKAWLTKSINELRASERASE